MKMVKCSIAAIAITASQLAAASGGDTWRYTGASYKSDAFSQAQFWTDNNGTGSVGAEPAEILARVCDHQFYRSIHSIFLRSR